MKKYKCLTRSVNVATPERKP